MKKTIVQKRGFLNVPVTKQREVFDTDRFKNGVAIMVAHHTGVLFNAIITESTPDLLQCIRVDSITGDPIRVEVHLEEYLAGNYIIKKLNYGE